MLNTALFRNETQEHRYFSRLSQILNGLADNR